ncbi:MAG TPA: hypothetical protein VF741_04620 [Candidatus Aquilonibacter sp.]
MKIFFVFALIFVNVMPAFWRAWDSTKDQPESARVAAFKEQVVAPNHIVYAKDEFANDLRSDDAIASYLERLRANEPALRAMSDRAAAEIPADIQRVQQDLPGLDLSNISVYVLPSFGHFNGQTADLGGGTGVLFGVDGLLEFDGPNANLGVIVAHEFFHIYQHQTHPGFSTDGMALWQAVWVEGSAAYASQQLTPGATIAQALGASLAATTPADRKALACYVQAHWDSRAGKDIDAMIDFSQHPPGLPPRGGYLIGYAAAQDMSGTSTVAQLGSAPMGEAEAALRTTVNGLCE